MFKSSNSNKDRKHTIQIWSKSLFWQNNIHVALLQFLEKESGLALQMHLPKRPVSSDREDRDATPTLCKPCVL